MNGLVAFDGAYMESPKAKLMSPDMQQEGREGLDLYWHEHTKLGTGGC